jgi:protease-4
MRFQHVAEQIYSKPWLITPSAHASIVRLFQSKYASSFVFDAKADDGINTDALFVQREPASLDVNNIGHVYIKGVIGQGLSKIEKSCGNTDTRDVQDEIAALVAQGAKGILLCIDSPGGIITGTPELAELIAETATEIPVFVFSDSQICSAAYWLAAGASKIICTESAEIGSIGVYLPWIDESIKWEQEGIAATPVINTGGTFKGIHLFPSLSAEHREALQIFVDRVFGLFKTFIVNMRAMNEAVVAASALQGQMFLGIDAITNGLVDELGNKDDAYEALLQDIDLPETPEPEAEPSPDNNQIEEAPANNNVAAPATS